MSQVIEIVIAPNGQSRLETKGFAGSACRDASRFLEEALGVRQQETLTSEFHKHAVQSNVRRELL